MGLSIGDHVVILFNDTKPNPSGYIEWLSQTDATVRVKIDSPARGYGVGDVIVTETYSVRPYIWARTLPLE